jgi:glycosyltransferase involved in cell wall biosynthesis
LYKKKLIIRCGYEWLEFLRKGEKSFWERMIVFIIEKIAYKNSERIILSSEKDKRFVENNFEIRSSKIEVIPNYIDTELFEPIKIEKYKSRIIFVGRLHKQKNLFNLIEAISGTS